jgi:hypothetical protein
MKNHQGGAGERKGNSDGGARGSSLVCLWQGKRGKDDAGLGGVWLRGVSGGLWKKKKKGSAVWGLKIPAGGVAVWKEIGLGLVFGFFMFFLNVQNCSPSFVCVEDQYL